MFNAKEIAEGFGNLIKDKMGLSTEAQKELFAARKAICDSCEHGQGTRCNLCGCVIAAKTKSLGSSCPDKLW